MADKRDAAVAQELLGASTDQVSTSDRFTAYNWLDDERHQTCWAHLLRTWRRFQLRDGPSAQVGGMLEIHTDYLLHRWRELQRGHLSVRASWRKSHSTRVISITGWKSVPD